MEIANSEKFVNFTILNTALLFLTIWCAWLHIIGNPALRNYVTSQNAWFPKSSRNLRKAMFDEEPVA